MAFILQETFLHTKKFLSSKVILLQTFRKKKAGNDVHIYLRKHFSYLYIP
jgi:hypothetical protein